MGALQAYDPWVVLALLVATLVGLGLGQRAPFDARVRRASVVVPSGALLRALRGKR